MNASSMSLDLAAADVATTTVRHARSEEPSGRFDIIRDMLDLLDSFTPEGQRYSMRKIVEFIEGQLSRPLHCGQRNKATLTELAAGLRREAERPWPSTDNFSLRAKTTIALLEALPHTR